ncbi:hypothetical protein AAC387_Pa04g3004 [Persea americana]
MRCCFNQQQQQQRIIREIYRAPLGVEWNMASSNSATTPTKSCATIETCNPGPAKSRRDHIYNNCNF